jgi:hypothetical protein
MRELLSDKLPQGEVKMQHPLQRDPIFFGVARQQSLEHRHACALRRIVLRRGCNDVLRHGLASSDPVRRGRCISAVSGRATDKRKQPAETVDSKINTGLCRKLSALFCNTPIH